MQIKSNAGENYRAGRGDCRAGRGAQKLQNEPAEQSQAKQSGGPCIISRRMN